MRLTKRGEYALRTLIRLGVAHRLGKEVLSVSQLAEAEHVPFKFLEQILGELRQAGYVESRRGKRLSRMRGAVRVVRIMRAASIRRRYCWRRPACRLAKRFFPIRKAGYFEIRPRVIRGHPRP